MADHLDSPGPIAINVGDDTANVGSPNGDARPGIPDVFAFLKPGDPSKSILILDVNPLAPLLAGAFNSQAVYEINVDTNGDAVADLSFRIRFSDVEAGSQTATVHLASGGLAAGPNDGGPPGIARAPGSFGQEPIITPRGEYRVLPRLRSGPFFFSPPG